MEFGRGQLVLASNRGRKCSPLAVHPTIEKHSPSWLQLFEGYRSFWGLLLWLPPGFLSPWRSMAGGAREVAHFRSKGPVRGCGFPDRARILEWTMMHLGKEGFCGTGLVKGAGWGGSSLLHGHL